MSEEEELQCLESANLLQRYVFVRLSREIDKEII